MRLFLFQLDGNRVIRETVDLNRPDPAVAGDPDLDGNEVVPKRAHQIGEVSFGIDRSGVQRVHVFGGSAQQNGELLRLNDYFYIID